jgi:N-acetylneuraminic acid mutarotase
MLDYTGDWLPVSSMQVTRGLHTATVLRDGRILIVGGYTAIDEDTSSVEIYDPVTNTFSPTGSLNKKRHGHSATLLADGRVLVIAGYNNGWLQDAEIYDPATGTWNTTQPLFKHGVLHIAVLLRDGRVLVMAGAKQSGPSGADDRVEIFDPKTNRWQTAAYHENTDGGATAALLTDGRVLIAGGTADPAIYDPVSDSWQPGGKLVVRRSQAQGVVLQDGRVLLIGGLRLDGSAVFNSVEIYDPEKNIWKEDLSLSQARYNHTATLLPDGRVLVAGGWGSVNGYDSVLTNAEVYDLAGATSLTIASLSVGRAFHTANLLPDGRVLIAGGQIHRDGFLRSVEAIGK